MGVGAEGGTTGDKRGREFCIRKNLLIVLLTTARSHGGHGTKLTNVVSRINETSYMR